MCASAGTLSPFSQPAAGITAPVTSHGAMTSSGSVTSPGSPASSLLRSLSRSVASATTVTSSSSTETPEVGDDRWRLREPTFTPTSVSGSTSSFSSVSGGQYDEETRRVVGNTVEQMVTGDWQHLKSISTHHYVSGTPSPLDTERRLLAQSSCVSPTLSVGALRSPEERTVVDVAGVLSASQSAAAWLQDPRQRLDLPPSSVTSLSLYARSRDTPDMTSRTLRRAQSSSVPACTASGVPSTSLFQLAPPSKLHHQNGDGQASLTVRGCTSECGQTTAWTSGEQKLAICEREEPATTTTATTDVWRPY